MMAALRPMRARFAAVSRFMMLSTAWSRVDEFWRVWESDDPTWIRIRSLADDSPRYTRLSWTVSGSRWARQRFGARVSRRTIGQGASPFAWNLFDRATAKT